MVGAKFQEVQDSPYRHSIQSHEGNLESQDGLEDQVDQGVDQLAQGRIDCSHVFIVHEMPDLIAIGRELRCAWRVNIRIDSPCLEVPFPGITVNVIREGGGGKQQNDAKDKSKKKNREEEATVVNTSCDIPGYQIKGRE